MKNFKHPTQLFIWTLFFLFACLQYSINLQASQPLLIDSDLVNYNGKLITLTGHATVNHELGKVEAHQIILTPETVGKKMHIAYLQMFDGVNISLQDGGHLSCSEAVVDYHALTGKFSSGPQGYVVYKENLRGRTQNSKIPLEVKSLTMSILLKRMNQQDSPLVINQITVDDDVAVNYNGDFFATADHGIYKREEILSDAMQEPNSGLLTPSLAGKLLSSQSILLLEANEPLGTCQIKNRNGDFIKAKNINIDILKHEILFDAVHGSLFTHRGNEKDEINFSCDTMIWNEPQDLLTLRDQVQVNYIGIGTLHNPYEIRIQRQLINGNKQLKTIDCLGETVLKYQDDKKHENHILTAYDRLVLNHQHKQAYLSSPRDSNNRVLENLQVHFSDSLGEIYADEVFVDYREIDKKMTPVKLFLKGNVWLLSRTKADKEDPGKFLQFVMADRIEYDIATKEMLCMADFNKRVLFFDRSNNLQVSAPSVKARRDSQTRKDTIQGMGDVRFSFIEKEFELMKKRFSSELGDSL